MESRIQFSRLSVIVLGTTLLGLGTVITGCSTQGQEPGDYRPTRLQACLSAATTKQDKNDCYFANAEAHGK